MGFILNRTSSDEDRLNAIIEGKSTKPSLEKIQVTNDFGELPGDDIEQVYGCYNGKASEILNVLNDITTQANKDLAEGDEPASFNQNIIDFISQMGSQKAFVFAYRNPNGLNANLYTSQVEFNNAIRSKKKSIKAINAFTDGVTKHLGTWNDLVTSFGELDEKKLNNLSNVLDGVLKDSSIAINKNELGKFFGMLSKKCLGEEELQGNEVPVETPTDTIIDGVEGEQSPVVSEPTVEEPVTVNGIEVETPADIEEIKNNEGEPNKEDEDKKEENVNESYRYRIPKQKRLGSHIIFN